MQVCWQFHKFRQFSLLFFQRNDHKLIPGNGANFIKMEYRGVLCYRLHRDQQVYDVSKGWQKLNQVVKVSGFKQEGKEV